MALAIDAPSVVELDGSKRRPTLEERVERGA